MFLKEFWWLSRVQVAKCQCSLKERLFAVRFMRCGWKLDIFFKCIRCFYVYVLFYDYCNTKRSIVVTHEVTWVSRHSGRAYRKGTGTCQIHRRMMIHAIRRLEVWLDQYFRNYREFMGLNFVCFFYAIITLF